MTNIFRVTAIEIILACFKDNWTPLLSCFDTDTFVAKKHILEKHIYCFNHLIIFISLTIPVIAWYIACCSSFCSGIYSVYIDVLLKYSFESVFIHIVCVNECKWWVKLIIWLQCRYPRLLLIYQRKYLIIGNKTLNMCLYTVVFLRVFLLSACCNLKKNIW